MKLKGLSKEKHGGKIRWRVRISGEENKRITLPVGPDDDDFLDHYKAARQGKRLKQELPPMHPPGTMGWLLDEYLGHLKGLVEVGVASPLTYKQRESLGNFVKIQESEQERTKGKPYHELPMTIPTTELARLKTRMAATPGKARNVWKLLIATYDFAVEQEHMETNPVRAVTRPAYQSKGGATPWTLEDLKQYREAHPAGTMAHLCLTIFMMTACRISDAYRLGRRHEQMINGQPWLSWQPAKKGSKLVQIPILGPLETAIRCQTVIGPTYLLTGHGKPFASPEALRNKFKTWCREASLEDRSSHGIRKAAGHLLALHGATQYQIMAVHGHANAATSQVYTETVERMRLGEMGASKLASLDW